MSVLPLAPNSGLHQGPGGGKKAGQLRSEPQHPPGKALPVASCTQAVGEWGPPSWVLWCPQGSSARSGTTEGRRRWRVSTGSGDCVRRGASARSCTSMMSPGCLTAAASPSSVMPSPGSGPWSWMVAVGTVRQEEGLGGLSKYTTHVQEAEQACRSLRCLPLQPLRKSGSL